MSAIPSLFLSLGIGLGYIPTWMSNGMGFSCWREKKGCLVRSHFINQLWTKLYSMMLGAMESNFRSYSLFFPTLCLQLDKSCWKEVMPIAPTSLWVLIICPHHVYTSLTQTRWGNKGWRFRNSHQCMPLNLIICPNNIFSCWREKVFNPNNAHERKKKLPRTTSFSCFKINQKN